MANFGAGSIAALHGLQSSRFHFAHGAPGELNACTSKALSENGLYVVDLLRLQKLR